MTRLVLVILLLSGAAQAAPTCRETVGPTRATALVNQCLEVTPATHPPCNASNPCPEIIAEIRRSCALLPAHDAPGFCRDTIR